MKKQTLEMIKMASRYNNCQRLNEREGNRTGVVSCSASFWATISCIAILEGCTDMEACDMVWDWEDGKLAA